MSKLWRFVPLTFVIPGAVFAASNVTVKYQVTSAWQGGFNGKVYLSDSVETVSGWKLEFDTANKISSVWDGSIVSTLTSASGYHYVIQNMSYNANFGNTVSVSFGFGASGTSTIYPTGCMINGSPCTLVIVPYASPTPTPKPSPTPIPTPKPSPTPTPKPSPTPTPKPSPTPTPIATSTPTPVASPTPAPIASPTATPNPVASATPIPSASVDPFGIMKIYPTTANGREWYMKDTISTDPEFKPESPGTITMLSKGVYRTYGQVRLNVVSPAGLPWWQNIEMTAYFSYTGNQLGSVPHWELFARGERHSSSNPSLSSINNGVMAPAGTQTWPWYSAEPSSVNVHCLGSSYHGNTYITGRTLFEKEVTHTSGYASQQSTKYLPSIPTQHWFGVKWVIRNNVDQTKVYVETYYDMDGTGNFKLANSFVDTPNAWIAPSYIDGCDAAPYNYEPGMLMTWAGPWATFRSDDLEMDFKQLSIREIDPAAQ